MNTIWIITKRELQSFFDSLIAYIILILFLGVSGFFTWLFINNVFASNQANLRSFFEIAYWTLFVFVPALTMRMLAEEKRSGTIELLLTKAVTDRQLVLGKFLACLMLILIALLCTLPYYITIAQLGNIDHGAVWSGYFGLILMSTAYISIGLLASSISNNQLVALLVALLIGAFFHVFFELLAFRLSGFLSSMLDFLSFHARFGSISRGLLDSKDVIYFLSVALFGFILTELRIAKR